MDNKQVLIDHIKRLQALGERFPTVKANINGFLGIMTGKTDSHGRGASFAYIVAMVEDLTEQVTNLQRIQEQLNAIIDAYDARLKEFGVPTPNILEVMKGAGKESNDG